MKIQAGSLMRRRPWFDIDIHACSKAMSRHPKCLADQSLEPIAIMRFSITFRNSNAQSRYV